MRRPKRTTTTTLVMELLVGCGDFMTARELVDRTKESLNRVSAALHHLQMHQAVGSMESDGRLWWYATPDTDQRTFERTERAEEVVPRKTKGRKDAVYH